MNIDKMIETLEEWQSEDQRDGFCPITYYALRAILLAGKEYIDPNIDNKSLHGRICNHAMSIEELERRVSELESQYELNKVEGWVRFGCVKFKINTMERIKKDATAVECEHDFEPVFYNEDPYHPVRYDCTKCDVSKPVTPKEQTITISRKVAEDWYYYTDEKGAEEYCRVKGLMADELTKALKGGE